MSTPALGIPEPHRHQIVEGLSRLLADTYTLYLKTHGFHWNVTGPMFVTLHTLFMQQYTELWNAVDPIAERIRALGQHAPAGYAAFAKLATVHDSHDVPAAEDMLRILLADHETVVRTARAVLPHAQAAHDEATVDLLVQRLQVHEKTAWMLRSLLA